MDASDPTSTAAALTLFHYTVTLFAKSSTRTRTSEKKAAGEKGVYKPVCLLFTHTDMVSASQMAMLHNMFRVGELTQTYGSLASLCICEANKPSCATEAGGGDVHESVSTATPSNSKNIVDISALKLLRAPTPLTGTGTVSEGIGEGTGEGTGVQEEDTITFDFIHLSSLTSVLEQAPTPTPASGIQTSAPTTTSTTSGSGGGGFSPLIQWMQCVALACPKDKD